MNNQQKYQHEKTIIYAIKLVKTKDADIIQKLESQENKQGYIKQLIRKDMEKECD